MCNRTESSFGSERPLMLSVQMVSVPIEESKPALNPPTLSGLTGCSWVGQGGGWGGRGLGGVGVGGRVWTRCMKDVRTSAGLTGRMGAGVLGRR